MLNAEKYKAQIEQFDFDFALLNSGLASCTDTSCVTCHFHGDCKKRSVAWLTSEYNEPKIEDEVYKLKCDDKVEVSDDGIHWYKRHFKTVECGCVFTWASGFSSFTARNQTVRWKYARIPRKENANET